MASRPKLAFSQPDSARAASPGVSRGSSSVVALRDLRASIVESAVRANNGSEVRSVLEELSSRLDTTAHRLLADSSPNEMSPHGMVDLGDYLRDVSNAVISAFSSQLQLHCTCDRGCFMPLQRALPIGLIIVELVTNAVKYAHPTGIPGTVTVACSRALRGGIVIEVSDDGVGLPEDLDPIKDGNLGLELVRSLAVQVGARIDFTSSALGLSVALRMSLEGAA